MFCIFSLLAIDDYSWKGISSELDITQIHIELDFVITSCCLGFGVHGPTDGAAPCCILYNFHVSCISLGIQFDHCINGY